MYWAGFFAADGCVRNNKSKSIQLMLATKDKNHLIKFQKSLKSEAKIIDDERAPSKLLMKKYKYKEKYFYSYICISSEKISNDLALWGITPRKTYTLTMPKWLIDHNMVRHFIRGYIDGDGSYSYNKKKDGKIVSIHVALSGACNAVKQIYEIIIKNCNIKYGNINNKKLNSFLFNSLQDVKNIYEFLYKDSTIFLDRKENIIKNIYNLLEKSFEYNFDPKELQYLYDKLGSFNAVAKKFGCDRTTIQYNMRKMGLKFNPMPQMSRKQ
jgi:hypothetical protein